MSADKKLLRAVPTDKRKEFLSALVCISDALQEANDESLANGPGAEKANGHGRPK